MFKEAIYHQPYGNYAYPIAEDTLFIQLRAKKGDLEQASIVYDGRYRVWETNPPRYSVEMTKYAADNLFDYFRAEIKYPDKRFRYYFTLDDGKNQLYYGGNFTDDIPESTDCFEYSYICERDYFTTPDWVKNSVFYQIFPDSFNNANPELSPETTSPWGSEPDRSTVYGGDLQGIIDKLDYLDELGIDAIYLTPIFAAGTTHKYDTIDYLSIDPQFGDLEDCKKLVNEAHKREIKVIFDAVFNHCSRQFFAFQDVVEKGAESEYKDWFYIDSFPIKENPGIDYPVLEKLARELKQAENLSYDLLKQEILPKFKLDSAQGEEYLLELGKEVIDQGSNFKISLESLRKLSRQNQKLEEMITPNYETFVTTNWNMPKLRTANPEVRSYLLKVARYWIEEVGIDGWRLDVANEIDHQFWREFRKTVKAADPEAYIVGEVWDDGTPWLDGDQFDGVMNYVFTNAVWDFFCRREINVEKFAAELAKVRTQYKQPAQMASLNLIDSHDTDRVLTVADNDKTRQKLAVAFQMTYLGPPMIYYGDEVGLTGEEFKSCRRSMVWEKEQQDTDLLAWYKRLIAICQNNSALRTGDFELVTKDAVKNIYAFKRIEEDNQLLVIFNNSPQNAELEFDLSELGIKQDIWVDLIKDQEYKVEQEKLALKIAGYRVVILA